MYEFLSSVERKIYLEDFGNKQLLEAIAFHCIEKKTNSMKVIGFQQLFVTKILQNIKKDWRYWRY